MMSYQDFVGLLASTSGGLQSARQEILDEWWPDEPPVTTLLGGIGCRIAEDFNSVDFEINRRLFSLIEEGMASSDQVLVEAVATGLVESLVTRAVQSAGLWEQMALLLGPRSLHHAKAWLAPC